MPKQTGTDKDKIYRLTLAENDTHKNIRIIRFSRRAATIFFITIIVVPLLLFYCLIAFTPLKVTIPGYPDAVSRKAAIDNALKIDSLENAMSRWELYAINLSKVLKGEETVKIDSIIRGAGSVRFISDAGTDELMEQDSLLRLKVKSDEQFVVGRSNDKSLPIEGVHFFTPAEGMIIRTFDSTLHPGIDVSVPDNAVVCSVLKGTVIYDGWDETDGYCIIIQHQGDIISAYRDNSKLLCRTGDKVSAGTPVALAGGAGKQYLHLEIWYKGDAVDPAKYINF